MRKEGGAKNEIATAKTEGLADGLAIDLARSLPNVEEQSPQQIININCYIEPLHLFQYCITTSISSLSNGNNVGINIIT